jgi:hypothetical protein
MTVKGKKLLILGANPETASLVQKANNMGVYALFFKNVRKIYVFLMSHIHRQSLCDLA